MTSEAVAEPVRSRSGVVVLLKGDIEWMIMKLRMLLLEVDVG